MGTDKGEFTIRGPGVIEGTSYPPQTSIGTEACVLASNGRVSIGDGASTVEILGCIYGVRGAPLFKGNGQNWSRGPEGRAQLQLTGVTLALNGHGTTVRTVTAMDVTAIDNNAIGIGAKRRVTVQNVTATNNGIGVFGGKLLTGANVTATGNGNGVDTCGFGHIELTNLVANENTTFGACGDTVALTDSTALDNGYADVAALLEIPVLTNTTCGTSVDANSFSWGVCADD